MYKDMVVAIALAAILCLLDVGYYKIARPT
jgi:hypothetical protein